MAGIVRRPKRRPMAEMNVVPYIDVMLVLLVIFMITAPLLKSGVDIELPQANAAPLDKAQQEPLVLSVDPEGGLYLNIGEAPDQSIAREEVVHLAAAVIRQNPEKRVLVAGDKSVDYGLVVDAMVLLQSAGAKQIGLITEPPKK